jgi:hypothetical protein
MKKLLQTLVVLYITVFMWSCEKEVKYNTIAGTLSPGQDMSQGKLDSVPVVIAKIWDTVDFATMAIDPANFEATGIIMTDASGYFFIDSLPDGNYLVAAGEGFKFADVDYVKITASDGSVNQVNKTVNRMPLQNGPEIFWVRVYNKTRFDITNVEFFINDMPVATFPMILEPRGLDTEKSGSFDILLDSDLYTDFRVTVTRNDTIATSMRLPFFDCWRVYECYILNYKLKIYDQWYDSKLYLSKGWFFGHYFSIAQGGGSGKVLPN